METDLSLWRSWRKHQLADGVENDLKLTRDLPTARLPHHATNAVYPAASPHAVLSVVFVFERRKLAGKFRIREEHLAQAHKCAHDGDVDLHGPRTPQDAGKHRDALFGEGIGDNGGHRDGALRFQNETSSQRPRRRQAGLAFRRLKGNRAARRYPAELNT